MVGRLIGGPLDGDEVPGVEGAVITIQYWRRRLDPGLTDQQMASDKICAYAFDRDFFYKSLRGAADKIANLLKDDDFEGCLRELSEHPPGIPYKFMGYYPVGSIVKVASKE